MHDSPRWALRAAAALAALGALLIPSLAYSQGAQVYQNGTMVPGHLAKFVTQGRIADAGGLTGDSSGVGLSPFSVNDQRGLGFCTNSAVTSGAYNAFCFGHDTNGNGLITLDSYNGEPAAGIIARINGTNYSFPGAGSGNVIGPTSPNPTVNDVVVWNGGLTVKSGGPLVTGVATNALLAATATATYAKGVWRLDYAAGIGAPPLFFMPQTGTCVANSLVSDGGSCTNSTAGDGNSWKAVHGGTANILEWGADPTGTADSASAVQAALTYAGTSGAKLVAPKGRFKIGSALSVSVATTTQGFNLQGGGAGQTTFFWPAAGGGITVTLSTPKQNIILKDFNLTTGVAGGGTALSLTNLSCASSCSLMPTSLVDHIGALGDDGPSAAFYWNTGLLSTSLSNLTVSNSSFVGSSGLAGDGVSLVSSAAHLGAGYTFIANNFSCLDNGLIFGAFIQGVLVENGNNFVCGNIGINVKPGTPGVLDGLSVIGNSFNHKTASIYIGANVNAVLISGNVFIPGNGTDANASGIIADAGFFGSISHNEFHSGGPTSKAISVTVAGGLGVIQGNACSFITVCINLPFGAGQMTVTDDNVYGSGVTTKVAATTGTTNHVNGTSSYTPTLGGSAVLGAPAYTVQSGTAYRAGNLITVLFQVAATGLGGATGAMRLAGLPFVPTGEPGHCAVTATGVQISGPAVGDNQYFLVHGLINAADNYMTLYLGANATNGALTALTNVGLPGTFTFWGSCTYFAA